MVDHDIVQEDAAKLHYRFVRLAQDLVDALSQSVIGWGYTIDDELGCSICEASLYVSERPPSPESTRDPAIRHMDDCPLNLLFEFLLELEDYE